MEVWKPSSTIRIRHPINASDVRNVYGEVRNVDIATAPLLNTTPLKTTCNGIGW